MTQSPPPLPDLTPIRRGPAVPAWDFLARNRHVTVPMVVPPAFLAAGAAVTTSPQAAIPTAVGAGVLAASVWWAAPHKWDRKAEQWYARLSAITAGAWLSATAFMGLGTWEALALAPLGLAWGIPWWQHKRARKHAASVVEQWAVFWRFYAWNWDLRGAELFDVTTRGVIDTLHVQLHAGHQTLADIKGILPKLESALQGHVAPGMTRCEHPPRRPDQVLIHLKRENPHDVEVTWDQSLAPVSVTGRMPLGKDEHGEWVTVPCMALNWFLNGMLGSGKSNMLSVLLASLTGCPDALVWVIDRKGGKAARPWIGAVDWVATTVEEARLMLRVYVDEVRARNLHGYDGNEEMTPSPEVPAIFLVIDEAHNVVADPPSGDRECQALLSDGSSENRSAAQRVIVATQYGALHASVGDEQTRGNLKNRMCFRVATAANGQFTLDDFMQLDASRLDNPGEFYYRLQDAESSAPARSPHLPHHLVREIAARNAMVERPPLELHASEHQVAYDSRWDRAPAVFRHAPLATPPEVPVTASEPPWQEALDRIEAEVATIPDLAAPPLVDDATLRRTMEGKKRLWAQLLQQAPEHGIKPSQLESGSGMGHTWTQRQLAGLVDLGVARKIATGRYVTLAGQDVWAGLEAIREGVDRFAQLAGV